jgi:murein DD-endopeptidase MepM/ murein hydrolase activator NlpD
MAVTTPPGLLEQGMEDPHGKGPIHGAQWLLSGHNVFHEGWNPGGIDGIFGENTAAACVRAKKALGYPKDAWEPTFGATLRAYLIGDRELPAPYKARRTRVARSAGGFIYPAAARVQLLGRPGQGTHSFSVAPSNWQSDNAWDFAFRTGTPLLAVADGAIGSRIGPISSDPKSRFGGLRCYLETEDNEFYYAHLTSFAPATRAGARVRQGDVIGFSGEASGVQHLHLGVRNWRAFQSIAEG